MNETTLRALIEAGAIKRCRIIGNGASFHIEFETPTGAVIEWYGSDGNRDDVTPLANGCAGKFNWGKRNTGAGH